MNVILQEQHAGDVSYSILDVDKVKKATGKASYIDVEEGMVDMNNYVLSLIRNNGC